MNFKKLIALFTCLVITIGVLAGCGGSKAGGNTVVIGTKDYTEEIILGEIFKLIIEEKTDLKVDLKSNLGATTVCFNAIKKGDLDIYPEFTGTALIHILGKETVNDKDEAYRIVQKEFADKYNIKWLKALGYNNTYVVAVKEEYAQKNNLSKVSDLISLAPNLTFGAEHDFFGRDDGYDGLIKTYGLEFKDKKMMDTAMKYKAMGQGNIDVTDAYSTDGELIRYKLKTLEDDKNFFPPYYVAPIIRMDTLKTHPELEEALNVLGGTIDEETMQQMNYKVDVEDMKPADVARDFLKSKGLVK